MARLTPLWPVRPLQGITVDKFGSILRHGGSSSHGYVNIRFRAHTVCYHLTIVFCIVESIARTAF